MKKLARIFIIGILSLFAATTWGQKKAKAATYIGYVYPAGGQQGTTVAIRIGGQKLSGVYGATVSGEGVHAKLLDCQPRINPQDNKLIKEQRKQFKKIAGQLSEQQQKVNQRIQAILDDYVKKPASESLSTLVKLQLTIEADAPPGAREIRLQTAKGLSNPLPFHIGQLPEHTREPMHTSEVQILGKEHLALRKRPEEEVEQRVDLPCILNGQIASGEVNRYRFVAKRGQKLVISTLARQLIPYIADAVPGWFQPVLTLRDAHGKEVAFNDDYFFKPDPVILYHVEADGEYLLTIYDSIYRGREDFIYRISLGETPFITDIFPLGAPVGKPAATTINGWNLSGSKLKIPSEMDQPGTHLITANRKDLISNQVPFALDTLPECTENEAGNNTIQRAQRIRLPIIINGRSDHPGDLDLFKFNGKTGQTIVAEVTARRLDSPLDSLIQLLDENGNILALNDDHADPGSGLNTHHADSYLTAMLPANGTYYIQINDTAQHGGKAYGYRLRVSKPRPDFELRAMPSSISLRGRSGGKVTIFAIRKDGYNGPIQLALSDPPDGLSAKPITLPAGEERISFSVKSQLKEQREPVAITITGTATLNGQPVTHIAVPSEDWMQAFLWRHLVPTQELLAQVYSPAFLPDTGRPLPALPQDPNEAAPAELDPDKKETKAAAARIKQLDRLYKEWLITKELYIEKRDEYKAFEATQQPNQ